MSKHFFIIVLLFSPLIIAAQKVVERSQKQRPDWIGTPNQDYLYASASDKDLEIARQKAMTTIKVEMLGSVAENIESSTESLMEQITSKGEVSSNIQIIQTGHSSVANLPFLSGVSFVNAKESYWEKTQDKDGKTEYTFHLLYPFSKLEYEKFRLQFEKLDNSQVEIVSHYEEELGNINSVDSIIVAIGKLQNAKDYFFDKQRKKNADNMLKLYDHKLTSIDIVSRPNGIHKFEFWLELNGKKTSCSLLPKAKAECASNIKCSTDGRTYTLTFSDEYCIPDDDNIIIISFNFNGHRLKHELHF